MVFYTATKQLKTLENRRGKQEKKTHVPTTIICVV